MARLKKTHDPFRWFDSSPEVIRLVVMMDVRYRLSLSSFGFVRLICNDRKSPDGPEPRAGPETS